MSSIYSLRKQINNHFSLTLFVFYKQSYLSVGVRHLPAWRRLLIFPEFAMDRFQAMQVFTRVVDANSFTLAADTLGLPRATVTTTIQSLERTLQVRLLNRTTRRLSLTHDGAAYYERCVRILADVEDAESSFHDVTSGARGRLSIEVPPSMGRLIDRTSTRLHYSP